MQTLCDYRVLRTGPVGKGSHPSSHISSIVALRPTEHLFSAYFYSRHASYIRYL